MTVKSTSIKIENNIPEIIKGLSGKDIGALVDTIGGMMESALVDKIHSGDSSWAPLSEPWVERKGHDNPWYFSGRLEGEIKYETRDDGVDIGIIDAGSYRDGENVATVAHQLEFGSSNIPMRPLFQPVFDEEAKPVIKEAVKFVKTLIKKEKI